MPNAAYVCESDAVPLAAVVTTTIAEPSSKLTLMFWPPRGIESCRRRRVGCPLKLADVSMMSNVTGSPGVLVLVDAKVTLVGVRCTRAEESDVASASSVLMAKLTQHISANLQDLPKHFLLLKIRDTSACQLQLYNCTEGS